MAFWMKKIANVYLTLTIVLLAIFFCVKFHGYMLEYIVLVLLT